MKLPAERCPACEWPLGCPYCARTDKRRASCPVCSGIFPTPAPLTVEAASAPCGDDGDHDSHECSEVARLREKVERLNTKQREHEECVGELEDAALREEIETWKNADISRTLRAHAEHESRRLAMMLATAAERADAAEKEVRTLMAQLDGFVLDGVRHYPASRTGKHDPLVCVGCLREGEARDRKAKEAMETALEEIVERGHDRRCGSNYGVECGCPYGIAEPALRASR